MKNPVIIRTMSAEIMYDLVYSWVKAVGIE
jgi:hypothetical protein